MRVIIADDSATARASLRAAVEGDGTLQVIAEARDGAEAVELCVQHRPDVALLDVQMPVLDGLSATKAIMARAPLPVVITSGALDADMVSFGALAAGAVDIVAKPRQGAEGRRSGDADQLRQTLRLMARVKVVRRRSLAPEPEPEPARHPVDLIAVAASTGGPAALARLLRDLPAPLPVPMLIVQHIMTGFVGTMADWLRTTTGHDVRIAEAGQVVKPGQVLVGPDDLHLEVERGGRLRLGAGSPVNGHRPSADELFSSVARVYGRHAVGIILTGMGDDGAEGLLDLHAAGALTIAEAESSCAVFGMPKVAIDLGAAGEVLPLWRIGPHLAALLGSPADYGR